jgi:hypothetical protein
MMLESLSLVFVKFVLIELLLLFISDDFPKSNDCCIDCCGLFLADLGRSSAELYFMLIDYSGLLLFFLPFFISSDLTCG